MPKKPHTVQVILGGYRYIATEVYGHVDISRDGDPFGSATWANDQLILNGALLPDDVSDALERKIKERMDANWDED